MKKGKIEVFKGKGIAKEQLEKEIGRPIVSRNNYLPNGKNKKKLKK